MRKLGRLVILFIVLFDMTVTTRGQDFQDIDSVFILKNILEVNDDPEVIAKSTKALALIYMNEISNTDSAKQYFETALVQYQNLGDRLNEANILYDYGWLHFRIGLMTKSIEIGYQALEIYEEIDHKYGIGKVHNTIANAYNYLGEHDTAIGLYEKSYEIFEALDNQRGMAIAMSNLAIIFKEEGENEKGLDYRLRAIEIFEAAGDRMDLLHEYSNLGLDYADTNDLEKALETCLKALSMANELNDLQYQSVNKAYLGIIYNLMGEYEKAISNSNEALELAIQLDQATTRLTALDNLTRSYEKLGNYKKANDYLYESMEIDSVMYSQENAAIRQELQTKYEVEKKDQENEILRQQDALTRAQLAQQRLINFSVISGFAVVLIFMALLFYAFRKIQKHKNEIQRQADKLKKLDEYKSRFFANISHDIRTPLTLISGYAEQVKSDPTNVLNEKSTINLERLERNSQKLITMADEIRDLILLEEGNLELTYQKVEIDTYLSLLVNMFNSAAEIREMTLNYTSEIDPSVAVHLDRRKFEKIIYNLVSNAIKYTPEGGEVSVTLRNESDGNLAISVSDNGVGIEQDELDLVFDRYYQTSDNEHKTTEGFGIGLALVKELVELHGGTISVTSEKGRGTTFKVVIPLNLDKATVDLPDHDLLGVKRITNELPDEPTSYLVTHDQVKPIVMVVDDHPEVREYIVSVISENYEIIEAKNGQHALELLETNKVDLIITDLMMPWLDGFGLIEKLQESEKLRSIPVMVVSARTTEEDKLKVLDQGVNNFMSKPFEPKELKMRIENLLKNSNGSDDVWERLINDEKKIDNLQKNILNKVNHLIVERIDDSNLTVLDLAEEICASERKTYRLIKDLTNHTPLDYIKLIRFDYAKDLLNKKRVKNASEAAKAIGMSNVTQFKSQYKKYFGVNL
ncbi:MAG: tetratricopeptide repeat protein [Cyclobacteriaceae bacterium]